MKWCVVGYDYFQKRYEFLSEWLSKNGIENKLDLLEISPTEVFDRIPELQQNYDQIRIEKPFRHEIFLETKKNEASMIFLKTADCFFKDTTGCWWLRSPMYEGINAILNRMQENLMLDGSALIVGAGGAARAAVASLVKVGYQSFNMTNAFDDQTTELIADLRRMYFDVKFNSVSQGQLVLLPGTNSIVVNATPLIDTNELLDELQYFNFLVPRGIVWDLTLSPKETPLIKEATEIGARVYRGYEFAAATDIKWMSWVFPEKTLSEKDYCQELEKVLD